MEVFTGHVLPADRADSAIEAAVRDCPDGCVRTIGELADRISVDKLVLIRWTRTDLRFAQLVALKVVR